MDLSLGFFSPSTTSNGLLTAQSVRLRTFQSSTNSSYSIDKPRSQAIKALITAFASISPQAMPRCSARTICLVQMQLTNFAA